MPNDLQLGLQRPEGMGYGKIMMDNSISVIGYGEKINLQSVMFWSYSDYDSGKEEAM
jgi:hypothetical protein